MRGEHDHRLFGGRRHIVGGVVARFDVLVTFRIGYGGRDVHQKQFIVYRMTKDQIRFYFFKQRVHFCRLLLFFDFMHQASRFQFDKKRVKVLLQSGHRSSCAFFLTCCRGERKRKPFNLGSLFKDQRSADMRYFTTLFGVV